jgi:uncharacterized protein YrrD
MTIKTRFKVGAAVYSVDDEVVGSIEHVVMDPVTKEATHLIVRPGSQAAEVQVIPVGWVGSSTEQSVTLYCRADQLQPSGSSA